MLLRVYIYRDGYNLVYAYNIPFIPMIVGTTRNTGSPKPSRILSMHSRQWSAICVTLDR